MVTTDTGRTITAIHNIPGVTLATAAVTQNGTATFSISGTQIGSGSITFTSTGLTNPTVSVPVTISTTGSASTAYSLFASSNTSTASMGQTITVWVRVMDQQGTVLASDNGRTIHATINGAGTLSATQATTVNGVAQFTVMGGSIGSATLTFTATGLTQPQTQLSLTFTN